MNHDNVELFYEEHKAKMFTLMELLHQPYESLMEMPWLFFEDLYKWKTDLEKEKHKRNKEEYEAQRRLQNKIKADNQIKMNRQRIQNNKKPPPTVRYRK